ncbi:MAG: hypothetical protein COW66_02705 [Flavobacteriaceae bacterium CG18_big_fil_WC_8_21_14_2_50_34_36]|nr:MAG: hypothetical protein COW66_02705 [Flavobacteriaceae bacterium CG18_big_fil_WC_8_21_14_2_50_34_36]
MRQYSSAYPIFDEKLKQIEMFVIQNIMNNNHPQDTITILHKLQYEVDKFRKLLVQNPSLNAINLGMAINEIYVKDDSVDGIHLDLQFVENPRWDRYSRYVFPIHIKNES